jgi:biotin carboxyl carrier protein
MEIRIGEKKGQEVTFSDGKVEIDGEDVHADILKVGECEYHVLIDGRSQTILIHDIDAAEHKIRMSIAGKEVLVSGKDRYAKLLESLGMSSMTEKTISSIKAPMPGLVLEILVEAGQEVKVGDKLIILEAMKMENVLKSPVDGRISKIHVEVSKSLEKNDLLLEFE